MLQATMPTAILGRIPSTTGAAKYDANNCGYNPIHTDMMGANWDYPEANRTARASIWQDHVDYTQGFLWFMSTDASVPASLRASQQEWGYCKANYIGVNFNYCSFPRSPRLPVRLRLPGLHHPRLWPGVLRAYVHRMLIGACNPMLHPFRGS